MAQQEFSTDDFICSGLQLATVLPPDAQVPAFSRGLGSCAGNRGSIPAPLIFSPLAYSLQTQARLAAASRLAHARAARKPHESSIFKAARDATQELGSLSRDLSVIAAQQVLSFLDALGEFGAALRALLNLPVPEATADGRFSHLLPRGKDSRTHAEDEPMFAAVLPGDSVAGLVVAQGIFQFLNIYNTLLVVRLILTWFPNPPQVIAQPLSTICDPYLNLFRGIIPPLGGTLDFSPILAFLVLNVFTNTAAAIPAELPGPQPKLARGAAKKRLATTPESRQDTPK